MKRLMIGTCFLISGVLMDLTLIVTAAMYLPHMDAWITTSYPSKLWFLIFAGSSKLGDDANGLGLGLFFGLGTILILLGIAFLLREYFSKSSKTTAHTPVEERE